jgi:hypothetical protein
MAVINCTPHTINLVYTLAGAEVQVSFEPSGRVIRIKAESVVEPMLTLRTGYPVFKSVPGELEDAPEPNGDLFIVSTMVAQNSDRYDFIAPDTGPTAIRENGQVKAVRGFQSFGNPWMKETPRPMRDYQDGLGGL